MIIASVVAIIQDGRILLVENRNGHWVFPGGKLEAGETSLQCLLREISEELPEAKLKNIDFFCVFVGETSSGDPFALHVYRADMRGPAQVAAEVTGSCWTDRFEGLDVPSLTIKAISALRAGHYFDERATLIAEGKTKIVRSLPGGHEVLIQSKDDITARDGRRRDIIEGKGILSTQTTAGCFRLLREKGIPNHFIEVVADRVFKARYVDMIPVEVVVRRLATGSYLKRTRLRREGYRFEHPVIDFYFKDDERHDPYMLWDNSARCFNLYDPRVPRDQGYLDPLVDERVPQTEADQTRLRDLAESVFFVLESAWERHGVTLVDLKIECGYTRDGELVVADVLENDSWRIWPDGDKKQMRDKQRYRDLVEVTPEALEEIRRDYEWVAERSATF